MAKRISSTSVNWSAVIEKFKPNDRAKLSAFKLSMDSYLREISSRPAELPKIDWNLYKSRISKPGMVDAFRSSYESLKVPYPNDQGLVAQTEKHNENYLKNTEARFAEIKKEIEVAQKKLDEIEKRMPYAQMTMEEFFLARPDLKIDPDKPKFWPHHIIESNESK